MQRAIPVYEAVPPSDGRLARPEVEVRAFSDHRAPQTRPPSRSLFAWGVMGFILGAVFWHFVGFWQFVRTIVLPLPKPIAHTVAESPARPTGCASFVLDRESGTVHPVPCRIVDLADRPAGQKGARLKPWPTLSVAGP